MWSRGLHALVLGTLHCLSLLGSGQKSALAYQTTEQPELLPHLSCWVTFGDVFYSVMGFSCTADPFTSNLAECGSPSTLCLSMHP